MKKILLSILFVFCTSIAHAGYVDFRTETVPDANMRVIEAIYIATEPASGTNISISTIPAYIHSVVVSSQSIGGDAPFEIWNAYDTSSVLGTNKVLSLNVDKGATTVGGVYNMYMTSGIVVNNGSGAKVTITYRER